MLDRACQTKVRHYCKACEADGWLFQPFAVVFGAIHPTARKLTEDIIRHFEVQHSGSKTYPFATFVWRALTSAAVMRAATQTMATATAPSGTAILLQLLEQRSCKRKIMPQLSESEDARSMGSTTDFHMGQFSILPSGSQSATPLRAASGMVIETAPRVTAASPLSSLAAANIPIAPDPEALSPPGPPRGRGEVKWQQQHPQSASLHPHP